MDTIKINHKAVKMIAHRGVSGLEKENTYPAFVAAGNRSYFGVETDIHVTKDKKFVIIHDESTLRVSNQTIDINVENTEYSAIKEIVLPDIDGSFNRQDIRIPLLADYVSICKKYQKKCVLELKNAFIFDDIKNMIEEIDKIDYLKNMIFISFQLENCINVKKILPQSNVQFLLGDTVVTDEIVNILLKNKIDLDIYYKAVDKQLVERLHKNNIKINCWTCDSVEDAEKLVNMGVDYITTNILE